jgi:hypothetical protein
MVPGFGAVFKDVELANNDIDPVFLPSTAWTSANNFVPTGSSVQAEFFGALFARPIHRSVTS